MIRLRSILISYDHSFTCYKFLDVWGKWVHTTACDFPGTDPSVMLLRNRFVSLHSVQEAPFMFCAHFRLGSNATRTPSKLAMALKPAHCRHWAFRGHRAGIPPKQQCQTTERKLKVNKPHFKQQVARPTIPVTESSLPQEGGAIPHDKALLPFIHTN